MTISQAVILGLVQGVTEFLPISSSGHLIFIPKLFGWADQGLSFDAFIHLATLAAVLIYFRSSIAKIIRGFFSQEVRHQAERRLGWFIILATIPSLIVGYLAKDWIEHQFRGPALIAANLIVWGVVLWIADRYGRSHSQKTLADLSTSNVLGIGVAQVLALVPGTSRSGITISAGLFSNLDKKSAAEFSFLLSIPAIGAAGAVKTLEMFQYGLGGLSPAVLAAGFLSSGIGGIIAIWGLMRAMQRWSLTPFVIYRILVGIAILLVL